MGCDGLEVDMEGGGEGGMGLRSGVHCVSGKVPEGGGGWAEEAMEEEGGVGYIKSC